VSDDEVIRPVGRPFGAEAAIVLPRGTLAPDTGVVKVGLRTPDRMLAFHGPARVFESSLEAEAALNAGTIQRGDVVVLRGQGVRGGPGMGGASRLVFALEGAGMGADVAVVTDGQLSGLVNKGLVVGEVQPEAAEGGPIALVTDGDEIEIDLTRKRIDLNVSASELAKRRAAWSAPEPPADSGWLSIYARTVSSLRGGASLIESARQKE
jgi:dihydroxy-acid dehydratase